MKKNIIFIALLIFSSLFSFAQDATTEAPAAKRKGLPGKRYF